MLTELRVTRADPAGNITLIIEGDVPAEKRASLGARLIAMPGFEAEQAGFVVKPENGGIGRLEMMGGEFCGNAVRAFGMYCLINAADTAGNGTGGHSDEQECLVEISGCENPVRVSCCPEEQSASAEMPLPNRCGEIIFPEPAGTLPMVEFDGIAHVIAVGRKPDAAVFNLVRRHIYRQDGEGAVTENVPAALGMMFLTENLSGLTPLVYVAGPETLYYEGSCASGSTAAAYYLAGKAGPDESGQRKFRFRQPAGELELTVAFDGGSIRSVCVGGKVRFGQTVTVSVDI